MEFFLNSSEIDFMILLYLQECGFNHSSYVFCREANIETCFSNEKIIPPGSLISLIQRGFVYSHLENDWLSCPGALQANNVFGGLGGPQGPGGQLYSELFRATR